MKAVQIGILAALVVCAGLLFKVYRGQLAVQPSATPAAQTTAAPAVAQAPTPAPPPAEEKDLDAPPPPAPAPATVEPVKKPSPTRHWRKKAAETTVAQNHPAADAAVAPAAQTPAPPPAAQSPAPEPTPAPGQPPHEELNPPTGTQTAPPPPRVPHTATIPAGTLISVRLGEALSSERNKPGDTFSGTLDQPLIIDGFAIAERGAHVQGKVLDSVQAGRVSGVASLAIHLTRLHTSDGQDVAVQSETFRKEGPRTRGEDAKKIGVGAAIGAAIGAIAGGGKGAAIGAGVGGAGGAGTVMATRGKPAELPVETRISFKLQEPVTLTERLH